MEYKSQVLIQASLAQVMKNILVKEDMKLWMKGFKSYELQEGKFFQTGSLALLTLDVGPKIIVMKERILKSDLPFSYKASYESMGVINIVNNVFEVVDEHTTLWKQESEFEFKNIAVKAFSGLVISIFKSQGLSSLNDFKDFVEANKDV